MKKAQRDDTDKSRRRSRASATAVAVAADAVAAVEAAKASPAAERRRSRSYSGQRTGLFKSSKGGSAAVEPPESVPEQDSSNWIDMGLV